MRPTLLAAILLSLPACLPPGEDVPSALGPDAPEARVRGLLRLGLGGPYVAGVVERLQLRLDGAEAESIEWSSNAGAVWSDGELVHWTLPHAPEGELHAEILTTEGEALSADFVFDVLPVEAPMEFAVSAAAVGQIDPTPDVTGNCQLRIGSGDVPKVVYRNQTHQQLWYATFNGSTWVRELVDGPGFDLGGQVGAFFDFRLDASGNPHIAYRYSNVVGQVRYATKLGTVWTREIANPSTTNVAYGGTEVNINLDPVNGNRPTILFTRDNTSSSDDEPTVAYRTGLNAWTEVPFTNGLDSDDTLGGAEFTAAGVLRFTMGRYGAAVNTWSAASGFGATELTGVTNSSFYAPLVLDGVGQAIVMTDSGTAHKVNSSWILSAYESFETSVYDIARTAAGSPRVATQHGSQLEFAALNGESFWVYTEIDDMDGERMSIEVDSSSVTHACYRKDSQVWFY